METSVLSTSKTAARNWWVTLFIGIFAVVLGVWMLNTPVSSYITLAVTFSVLMFISGISEIYFSIAYRRAHKAWGWYLLGGMLDLFIGIILIVYPFLSLAVLPFFVGFWILLRALLAIGTSMELRSMGYKSWGWLMLMGIITMFFSFFVFSYPILGSISVVLMTAFSFITIGLYNIVLAIRIRRIFKLEHK